MANFELFSSLKVNIEKCEVCWLGNQNIEGIKIRKLQTDFTGDRFNQDTWGSFQFR